MHIVRLNHDDMLWLHCVDLEQIEGLAEGALPVSHSHFSKILPPELTEIRFWPVADGRQNEEGNDSIAK